MVNFLSNLFPIFKNNKSLKFFIEFKNLFKFENKKTYKLIYSFWNLSIIINIIAIFILYIFNKYYITINLLFLAKELISLSTVVISFSTICAIVFENYFLKQ